MIFGRERNKHLTDNFIKSTLNYVNYNTPLNNIKINSEFSLEKLNYDDKGVRLDVLVEYDECLVAIEMQNENCFNIYERARCYFAKICATRLERGDDYLKLKPLIMILILNYEPKIKYTSDYVENLVVVNNDYREVNVDMGIKFIFIFLPRLKNCNSLNYDNPFIQWLKFLEYKDREVIEEMATKNVCIKGANDELIFISAEENARRLKWAEDNALLDIRLAYTHGVDTGRSEGLVEGESSGKLKALLEIAKKLLAEKYPINKIKELTGLTESEINTLVEQ